MEAQVIAERRSPAARRRARSCREKFLDFFPDGFRDETYVETERAYKWNAHRQWVNDLHGELSKPAAGGGSASEIARRATRVESRTNLLFSFEKMALRDAVAEPAGARGFAAALSAWIYGPGPEPERFAQWCDAIAALPRRQTRVLTWPVVTVFGFIAKPRRHMLLKPNVTRRAAEAYGFDFDYASTPQWRTYASLLDLARLVSNDLRAMQPRDMIDIQSFLWVQGSDEYQ